MAVISGHTWTYGDPTSNDLYMVRALLGDTDEDDQLISDEEVTAYLSLTGSSVWDAAAIAAGRIAADFDRQATEKEVGDLRVVYQNRATGYRDMSLWLRQAKYDNKYTGITAGGLSKSQKVGYAANLDAYTRTIYRGFFTHEGGTD